MVHGTKFLRETYQNIVRINLLDTINKMKATDFIIIYGEKDSMVNPNYVLINLNPNFQNVIYMISGGSHNIGVSHVDELISIIKENS